MSVIKSYTDLEQSEKLSEILPIESADMWYSYYGHPGYNSVIAYKGEQWFLCQIRNSLHNDVPCWSLAALLNLLPSEFIYSEIIYEIRIRKYALTKNVDLYQIAYGNIKFDVDGQHSFKDMVNTGEKENLVDVCYEMIVELKERNLI